jgi:acyl-CoA reductase-like NAD-dependent aldehyde dehydrogenase
MPGIETINSIIDNQEITFDSARDTDWLEVINPANGKTVLQQPVGSVVDVDRAVASCRNAVDDKRWSGLAISQRRQILHRFADLIADNAAQLDTLDAVNMGKPVSLAMANAQAAATLLRDCAESVDKITGAVFQNDSTTLVTQQYQPRGVVAAIVPWNFPIYNALLKVAPALATGNCVVLKPSELAPHSAFRLTQLAAEAGLPDGVLNLVMGAGEIVGRALALHVDVDMIAFTGSTAVGKQMMQYAGQSNLKVVQAECGGKSPQLVFADVDDLDVVAAHVAQLILINQGQLCVAGSRLLVQRQIQEPLLERVIANLEQVVIGDPVNAATQYGPMVSQPHRDKVLAHINNGCNEGAELVLGGKPCQIESEGYYLEPTVFVNVSPTAGIAQQEIFGPVLSVTAFDNTEQALQLANNSAYGLAAYVWTKDASTAMQLGKGIKAGMVTVNSAMPAGEWPRALSVEPYGLSGVGVEAGMGGMASYLRRQVMWVNH